MELEAIYSIDLDFCSKTAHKPNFDFKYKMTSISLSKIKALIVSGVLAIFAMESCLGSTTSIDWPEVARQDLLFFHKEVMENHPGPVNLNDPDFLQHEEEALHIALQRSQKIKGYAGYYWLLQAYAASFNDRHVFLWIDDDSPSIQSYWPGFLTRFSNDEKQIVVIRDDQISISAGAELVSCDGVDAYHLAEVRVGDFFPAWALASQRHNLGYRLLLDQGNPFINRPKKCTFNIDGAIQSMTLEWRPLNEFALKNAIDKATSSYSPQIALRQLADESWWLSLPTFDSLDEDNEHFLSQVIYSLERYRSKIIDSPRLVIDLRGNSGGLSDWAERVTNAIWGSRAVDALPANRIIDWRVSVANYNEVKARLHLTGLSKNAKEEVASEEKGLRNALHFNEPFWRETDKRFFNREKDIDSFELSIPVYVLTDRQCFSACLDAVYMLRSLGAVQVGKETGGDTVYLDQRVLTAPTMPSGLSRISLPMKVYRDKDRASNQPWVPQFIYDGDLSDTKALEHWVSSLPVEPRTMNNTFGK